MLSISICMLRSDAARCEGEDVQGVPAHVCGWSVYAGPDNSTEGLSILSIYTTAYTKVHRQGISNAQRILLTIKSMHSIAFRMSRS